MSQRVAWHTEKALYLIELRDFLRVGLIGIEDAVMRKAEILREMEKKWNTGTGNLGSQVSRMPPVPGGTLNDAQGGQTVQTVQTTEPADKPMDPSAS